MIFKSRTLVSAAVLTGAFFAMRCGAEVIEFNGFDIFDNAAAEEAEGVQIVNGRIVLTGAAAKKPENAAAPDPAGDQVLELTDGSQLHGKLTSFGKSELAWQRGDTTEPLTFSPQDVKRITFAPVPDAPPPKVNATLQLQGGDWLTGDLLGMTDGKFRLGIEGAEPIVIDRANVQWVEAFSKNPPDAYEGPTGPMGLAGWDTGGAGGTSAWDYADGALIARAATPIVRRFEALTDRLEIEFSASDGGGSIRGIMFQIQPGLQVRGYAKGSLHLRFQANNINLQMNDGSNIKNASTVVPEEKNSPKETRYRILQDRRSGKLIIFVNGKKVADWETPGMSESVGGGTLIWQPTYLSSNMPWTLSKVRVRPWDGSIEAERNAEEAAKDVIAAGNNPPAGNLARYVGTVESIGANSLKFSGKGTQGTDMFSAAYAKTDAAKFSGKGELMGKEPVFIRLSRSTIDPPAGSVARVWLAQRGEFDVSALGVRDGQLKVRTSFGGDLTLPLTAVRAIEFPHRIAAADKAVADGGDTLIFRNGDELRGTLLSATHDQKVQWKPVKGERPNDFAVSRLAGILLADRTKPADKAPTTAVRFRNGDWVPGELLVLDKTQLMLKSAIADHLRVDRTDVRALYFGRDSEVPVWDGASDRQAWMKTANPDGSGGRARKDENAKATPWRYLDGAFSIPKSSSRYGYNNGPNIGRTFETLPDKVEVSFDLSTPKGPAGYSIQLFNDENRQGLMIQGGWDSAYIYDMSPRRQAGVVFNQPQQVDFGDVVGSEGNRRSFRFLADRRTGRLVMIVNGIAVGGFGQRPGKESAKPGKAIAIVPQPVNSGVTISNLWVGPWTGEPPDVPKNAGRTNRRAGGNLILNGGIIIGNGGGGVVVQKPEAAEKAEPEEKKVTAVTKADAKPAVDLVSLVNGDETAGTLESATASELHLVCDVGTLDIPMNRTLVAEFAGTPQPPASGVRLHLAGKGTLTVDSLRLADGKVICHSAVAGDLAFAKGALSEIIFQPRNVAPPESTAAKKSSGDANPDDRIIFPGNGGRLQIQGNVIIN